MYNNANLFFNIFCRQDNKIMIKEENYKVILIPSHSLWLFFNVA